MKVLEIKPGSKSGYFSKIEGLDKSIFTLNFPPWNKDDELEIDKSRLGLTATGKSYTLPAGYIPRNLSAIERATTAAPSLQPQIPTFQAKDNLWIQQDVCFKGAIEATMPALQIKPLLVTEETRRAIMKLTEDFLDDMIEIHARHSVVKNG